MMLFSSNARTVFEADPWERSLQFASTPAHIYFQTVPQTSLARCTLGSPATTRRPASHWFCKVRDYRRWYAEQRASALILSGDCRAHLSGQSRLSRRHNWVPGTCLLALLYSPTLFDALIHRELVALIFARPYDLTFHTFV